MPKTIEKKASQVAHEPVMSHSLKDASKQLGKSQATVKRYKTLLVKTWSNCLNQVIDEKTGSLTQQGIDELFVVARYMSDGDPEGYEFATFKKHPELIGDELAHEPIETVVEQRFQEKTDAFEVVAYEPSSEDLRLNYVNSNFDLTAVRGDVVAIKGIDDVLAIADQVLEGAEDALNEDLAQQQLQLQKITDATEELRGKRQKLQIRKAAHQERTLKLQTQIELAKEDFQGELGQLQH